MDKLVSVLIPTRERTNLLLQSINTLYHQATIPQELEILVKFDADDTDSILQFLSDIRKSPFVDYKALVTDRKGGYADLHIAVNLMCKMASGEFLMLFNDDAFMMTQGWDGIIRGYKGKFVCLYPDAGNRRHNTFPIVHRKYFETLGHFSLQTHNDTWVEEVSRMAEIEIRTPDIVIRHSKNPAWRTLYRSAEFASMRELRMQDAEKIKEVLS